MNLRREICLVRLGLLIDNACLNLFKHGFRITKRLPGKVRHLARRAGELQDVHPGVGAVDSVDVAPVVHFDVVGLDRYLAMLVRALPTQRLSVLSVMAGM